MARKIVLAAALNTSPEGNLAKAFCTYRIGKQAPDCALSRSRASIEDNAATTAYTAAMDAFEKVLEPAFQAQDEWVLRSNEGSRQNFTSFKPILDSMHIVAVVLHSALSRWSAVAIEANKSAIFTTMENAFLVWNLASWVCVDECRIVCMRA